MAESIQGVSAPDRIAAAAESSLIDKPFENHNSTTTPAAHSFVFIPEEKPYIPEEPSDRNDSDKSRGYSPQLPVSILPSADDDQSTTIVNSVSMTPKDGQPNHPLAASTDFERRFKIGQQRCKEVFSANERDRRGVLGAGRKPKGAGESEQIATLVQDERKRDEQAAASQTYYAMRFKQVDEMCNEAKTMRGQQYDTAQTLRASLFREARVWDVKHYNARMALEVTLL